MDKMKIKGVGASLQASWYVRKADGKQNKFARCGTSKPCMTDSLVESVVCLNLSFSP